MGLFVGIVSSKKNRVTRFKKAYSLSFVFLTLFFASFTEASPYWQVETDSIKSRSSAVIQIIKDKKNPAEKILQLSCAEFLKSTEDSSLFPLNPITDAPGLMIPRPLLSLVPYVNYTLKKVATIGANNSFFNHHELLSMAKYGALLKKHFQESVVFIPYLQDRHISGFDGLAINEKNQNTVANLTLKTFQSNHSDRQTILKKILDLIQKSGSTVEKYSFLETWIKPLIESTPRDEDLFEREITQIFLMQNIFSLGTTSAPSKRPIRIVIDASIEESFNELNTFEQFFIRFHMKTQRFFSKGSQVVIITKTKCYILSTTEKTITLDL